MKYALRKRPTDGQLEVVQVNWVTPLPGKECFFNDDNNEELYLGCTYLISGNEYGKFGECNVLPIKELEELTEENIKLLPQKFQSWLLSLIKQN